MNTFLRRWLAWALAVILWFPASSHLPGREDQPDPANVDPRVLADTAGGGRADFILVLAEQADLSAAQAFRTRQARGRYVYETLRETAERAQAPLLEQLDALGLPYRSYYVANLIAVQGDRAAVSALAAHPLVARVESDAPIPAALPAPVSSGPPGLLAAASVEWNIARINADDVWAQGYTGQGAVVADQDTGFQWDHPALKNQYRGWGGGAADHNFNWWDAIHADISGDGTNPCGFSSAEPCDDDGHGTHTLGTAVGDDGAGNQIGVAPGAKWVGCRNMDSNVGRPTTYIECFQFFLAPWDLNGQNPDPDLAPDVINNSWYCPTSELCTGDSLLTTVENVRAAGIVVAIAAGNFGPSCGTVSEEPGFLDAATTVGATDDADQIAGFSSRGPVTVDGSNRLKPDISAPGVDVRSSIPTDNYGMSDGTSMATPHLAGAVALLLSAHPEFSGDVSGIEQRLFLTAHHRTATQNCGGVPGAQSPNNTFGWGILDAYAAAFNDLYYLPILHK